MDIDLQYIMELESGNREGVDVEFKETTGQLNRGMETLCGMMNGSGGIVVFGVHNNGKMVGQDISDKTTRDIGEALRKFDPGTSMQPSYIPIDNSDKMLIAFSCDDKEPGKPFMWDGKPYQRHDSVTSVMPREKFLRLCEIENGLTYKWEDTINENMTVSSLDEGLIHNIINSAVRRGRLTSSALNDSATSALRRFKVMRGESLCNSAALLFGKDLYDYNNFKLRLARFKGIVRRDFIDNMQVEGNIFELVDAAMSFFFKHLSLSGTTHNRIVRKDELEIPYDALRESVVNALCHRAWQYESSTIGIAIFDDRIEIENAGHFPARLTPIDILAKEENKVKTSLPPNPIIANVMYLAGYIENWGRGLSMMNDECDRVGLPSPKIVESGNIVKLIFTRPQVFKNINRRQVEVWNDMVGHSKDTVAFQNGTVAENNGTVFNQNGTVSSQNDTVDELKGKIKDSMMRLITLLGEDWYNAETLCQLLGFKSKSAFIRTYINKGINLGLLRMENPDSPNAPNQRYGLTVKGKSIYYTYKN